MHNVDSNIYLTAAECNHTGSLLASSSLPKELGAPSKSDGVENEPSPTALRSPLSLGERDRN